MSIARLKEMKSKGVEGSSFDSSFPHSNLESFPVVLATTVALTFWAMLSLKAALGDL
jgi:hypothetical protein